MAIVIHMLGLHAHICRLIREGNQPPKKGMLCIVGNFWLRCWCERDNLIANSSPIFLAGREIGNATIELAVWKATCAWISHAWQSQNNNGGDIFPHARTYSIFGHAMPCISLCGVYSSKQNTPPSKKCLVQRQEICFFCRFAPIITQTWREHATQ